MNSVRGLALNLDEEAYFQPENFPRTVPLVFFFPLYFRFRFSFFQLFRKFQPAGDQKVSLRSSHQLIIFSSAPFSLLS